MNDCLASRRAEWRTIAAAILRQGAGEHASYIQAGLVFAQPSGAVTGAVVCLCITPERASAVRAVAAALGVTVTGCEAVHADAEATIAEIEAALHRRS